MRSLVPDSAYYQFIDELHGSGLASALVPLSLMREFPTLRAEEAKAIYADWRALYRKERAQTLRDAVPRV